jgi:hypothetical protein
MLELNNFSNFNIYEGKHFESIFTRFYQAYILPNKFNIDKRKVHLSNLIITKHINREQALQELKNNKYLNSKQFLQDKKYFLKKMNFSNNEFEIYIKDTKVKHDEYNSEKKFWEICDFFYKKFFKF